MHVIATAGHVDHGKSALLRTLTGMEPDRWAEEKRRGMTIDLGYAWMTLPSGDRLAFVDVPGHARFVPNMLAGVGPVPAVLFVVAADGGWMPQSAEHLAAVDALGITSGLLVITRSDLADPGHARAQAAEQLKPSSLGEVRAVAVSAVTGAGLPELISALDDLASGLPPAPASAPGADLGRPGLQHHRQRDGGDRHPPGGHGPPRRRTALTPAMRPVRVRALQSLGDTAAELTGVARVALNLRGIDLADVRRGMALIRPGRWIIARQVDVRLGHQPGRRTARDDDAARGVRANPGQGQDARQRPRQADAPGPACRSMSLTGCCCAIPARPRARTRQARRPRSGAASPEPSCLT